MVQFGVADMICRPISYDLSLFFSTLPFVPFSLVDYHAVQTCVQYCRST
jgi:hypothetical protein